MSSFRKPRKRDTKRQKKHIRIKREEISDEDAAFMRVNLEAQLSSLVTVLAGNALHLGEFKKRLGDVR